MAKKKIRDRVADMLAGYLEGEGLELYNVEYVKEGKDMFLRVYIDKAQTPGEEEQYVGTDDCERVSRYLSDRLDEAGIISQKYYLIVSSPGMDRELVTEEHYRRYVGRTVDVSLYRPVNGTKSLTGVLEEINGDGIVIKGEDGGSIALPKENIAKTKLAVIF
ncbi:MAG: ribosome maturation factor RimP [Anaerovoracaceae bacterium]|nr:ribosome maturation factor RimP [Anaerovoracaceae bacterium]